LILDIFPHLFWPKFQIADLTQRTFLDELAFFSQQVFNRDLAVSKDLEVVADYMFISAIRA